MRWIGKAARSAVTFAANGLIRSTAAADGENVYLADRTGELYALDADDGSLQWKLAGGSDGKPLDPWDYYDFSPGARWSNVFYGSGDHKLYAVDTNRPGTGPTIQISGAFNASLSGWNGLRRRLVRLSTRGRRGDREAQMGGQARERHN